ncbi:MAG: alanine--tRNA ligase, partial [candidate division Zixibacteria bacterium]|nr:alanine--tRNA ligase [candidate division Zixibacteria bacterium]
NAMGDVYPELAEKEVHTTEIIKSEEEAFGRTLDRGLEIFTDIVRRLENKGGKIIPGEEAFKLYDTYGFPVDLTQIMAAEKGFTVDLEGYDVELQKQRERSREGAKDISLGQALDLTSEFIGYDTEDVRAKVIHSSSKGKELTLVLDKTPFYAEAGGQVGDTGSILGNQYGLKLMVKDTQKRDNYIVHECDLLEGEPDKLPKLSEVEAVVDSGRRNRIKRNHTATHLLHKALRDTLGEHVAQAGSFVGPDYLRFDFSHYKALTEEEISSIEEQVNRAVLADYEVSPITDVPIEKAKAEGAMALFGEKYGETVRVVRILKPDGDKYSIELCGGTHVNRTGEIGLFVISSESAIAAGMRRIEALTGEGAYRYLKKRSALVSSLGEILKATPDEIAGRVESLLEKNKELGREVNELRKGQASGDAESLIKEAVEVNGSKVVVFDPKVDDRGQIMNMADALREKLGSGVGVLGSIINGKVALVAVVTDDLINQKKVKAGDVVKEVAKLVDGSGGGKPHLAQAGGKSPEKLPDALKEAVKIVENILK